MPRIRGNVPAAAPEVVEAAGSGADQSVLDVRLQNGARVVCMPLPGPGRTPELQAVAVQLWVLAGTSAEREREHGCAHLLEHMLFKPLAGAPDIATGIEAMGGDVNAYTTHDETVVYATVPAGQVGPALDALIAPVVRPALDPAELERETEVVLEEIKQSDDDPAGRAAQALLGDLFRDHSYARPVLGLAREVASHGVRRVRAFHRRNYSGERMMLVVAGPIDHREVLARAEPLLGSLPPTRASTPESIPAPPQRSRVRVRAEDVHEAQILIAWQAPGFGEPDATALEVAAVVLGHGEASRLVTQTRRRAQLVSDVHASFYASRAACTFMVSGHTTAKLVEPATQALLEQVAELASVPVDGEELARARAVLESDVVYRRETVQGQAHALGFYASLTGDLHADREFYRQLRALEIDDIRRACATHLVGSRAAVSIVVPETGGGKARAARIRTAISAQLRTSKGTRRGKRSVAVRQRREGIWVGDLKSGVRLRAFVDRTVPMAAGWIVWPGGLRLERARDAGASALMARLLTRGTADRDGDRLAREIDGMAASLDGFSGRNSLGLHFECLAADVPTVIRRALECALAPEFPESEVDEERRVALQELAADADDLGETALRAAMGLLYGRHPFHRSRRGTPASLDRIDRARLRQLWHGAHQPGRAVVAVSGDIDVESVAGLIDAFVPNAKPPERFPKWPGKPPSWPARARERKVVREREQAHIVLAYPGLTLTDRRVEALEVLMTVLGGQSGRLFYALREEQGLVYHVSASSLEGIDAGHVVVYASTSQDKLVTARTAMEREVQRLLDERIPGEELDRAKSYLIGQFEAGLQRRSRVASHIAFNELYGLGYADHFGYASRISRVSQKQLRTLARELLAQNRQAAGLVTAG